MPDFAGTGGADNYPGTDGNDSFFMQQGGDDNVSGLGGRDGFYFGTAYTSADIVDGGVDIDTLALQGNYLALTLGSFLNVEVIAPLPGNDTRFGDNAGNFYSYNITTTDASLAAGTILTIVGGNLRPGENLIFNGSAETDGNFRVFAGQGLDNHRGGAGSDGFFFGADGNLNGSDRIDGGPGIDSIALRGNYVRVRAVNFQNDTFKAIEVITFLSGWTNEFGGIIDTNGFDYTVLMADGNVAPGQRLDVIAGNLRSNETLFFNGSFELDGSFRVISGAGDDTIFDSQGNDQLFGRDGNDFLIAGFGSDLLDGGKGDDIFLFDVSMDQFDTVVGGSGFDVLRLASNGKNYTDSDFTNASGLEALTLLTLGRSYTFGSQFVESGMRNILDTSAGASIIDLSAIAGQLMFGIDGGVGGDSIAAANVSGPLGGNIFYYDQLSDSFGGAGRNFWFPFGAGSDRRP